MSDINQEATGTTKPAMKDAIKESTANNEEHLACSNGEMNLQTATSVAKALENNAEQVDDPSSTNNEEESLSGTTLESNVESGASHTEESSVKPTFASPMLPVKFSKLKKPDVKSSPKQSSDKKVNDSFSSKKRLGLLPNVT